MCVGDADEAGGKIFFITITIIFIININISAVMVLYADWFGWVCWCPAPGRVDG